MHDIQVDIGRVMTLCALMTSLLCGNGEKAVVDFSMEQAKLHALLTTVFVFSYVWSIGGNLVEKSMDAFDTYCRELFSDNHEVKVKLFCIVCPLGLPACYHLL